MKLSKIYAMFTFKENNESKTLFQKLSNAEGIKIKDSYMLLKILKKLKNEYDTIEDFRHELVSKYAEKEEDGSMVIKEPEKVKKFTGEFNEFLNETEFNIGEDKIKFDWLENVEIKPSEVELIEDIIE